MATPSTTTQTPDQTGIKNINQELGIRFGTEINEYVNELIDSSLNKAMNISKEKFDEVNKAVEAISVLFDGDTDNDYQITDLIKKLGDVIAAASTNEADIDALGKRADSSDKATEQIKNDLLKIIKDNDDARLANEKVVADKIDAIEKQLTNINGNTDLDDFKTEYAKAKKVLEDGITLNGTGIADLAKKLGDLETKLLKAIQDAVTLTGLEIDEITADFRAALRGTAKVGTTITPVGATPNAATPASSNSNSGTGVTSSDGLAG